MKPKTYIDHAADDMREAIVEVAKDLGLSFDEAATAVYRAMGDLEEEQMRREQDAIERADAICHARMEA